MLANAVTLGQQVGLFSSPGPASYEANFSQVNPADTDRVTREWFQFVGSEVAKRFVHPPCPRERAALNGSPHRLAFSLIHFSGCLHLLLGPAKEPLFALETFGIPGPCAADLWTAPDAQSWYELAQSEPVTAPLLSVLVSSLLQGQPPPEVPLEPLQLEATLDLLDVHLRNIGWNRSVRTPEFVSVCSLSE